MEAAIKRINPSTHLDDISAPWTKPAVCLRGHKYATCVINEDSGIHLIRLPVRNYDKYAQPLAGTPRAVAQKMISFTRREVCAKPITKGALELLTRVASGDIPSEDVEFKDEPMSAPTAAPETNGEAPATRSTLLATICSEIKMEPTAARRRLRKAGLSAPYNDEIKLRSILQTFGS